MNVIPAVRMRGVSPTAAAGNEMARRGIRSNRLLSLWPLLLPSVFGAYAYFFSDTFVSGISSTSWYSNGTIAGGSGGLSSSATNGGSVIYKPAIPDGTSEYELKATLTITATGGTFVMYMRASNDALTGPAAQGSYF